MREVVDRHETREDVQDEHQKDCGHENCADDSNEATEGIVQFDQQIHVSPLEELAERKREFRNEGNGNGHGNHE